jgi:hypothetical protein
MKRISWLGWLLFALTIIVMILFWKSCGVKPKPVIVKKQGKEVIISSTRNVYIDTIVRLREIIAQTKPKIIYRYLKPTHDYTEQQPNYVYSPCDSVVIQSDSGTKEGVKYAIRDTLSGNSVIGRSIRFNVPVITINKLKVDSTNILRVDTVYITTKQKFGTNAKWFIKGFIVGGAIGLGTGMVIPK